MPSPNDYELGRPMMTCLDQGLGNRVLVNDLDQPKGPVVLPDGTILLHETEEARERVTRLDPTSGPEPFARPGG